MPFIIRAKVRLVLLLSFLSLTVAAAWFGRRPQKSTANRRNTSNKNGDTRMRSTLASLAWRGSTLHWFRLDDNVMGGRSTTTMVSENGFAVVEVESSPLRFMGTINTNGGGFCSLRATLPHDWCLNNNVQEEKEEEEEKEEVHNQQSVVVGVRLRYRGDGKNVQVFVE